jgi:competence protein ComEC
VLRIEALRGSALLTGDISGVAESALLARHGADLKADVLVVPHHGSATSSTQAFVDAVSPRYAVFSMGYRNRFGHPRAEVVERYRAAGSDRVKIDSTGAFTVRFEEAGISASADRDARRRYWHGR